MEEIITRKHLKENPNHIFVFGDNLLRKGKGGAAVLRDEPNTYGFITKKYPNNNDESFYHPEEYFDVYQKQIDALRSLMLVNTEKVYLISKIGAGLANRYNIFEKIIEPNIRKDLEMFNNKRFLW
jgi:hypothetical protein